LPATALQPASAGGYHAGLETVRRAELGVQVADPAPHGAQRPAEPSGEGLELLGTEVAPVVRAEVARRQSAEVARRQSAEVARRQSAQAVR